MRLPRLPLLAGRSEKRRTENGNGRNIRGRIDVYLCL